jgi:protein tyrosine phosphatase (PTP) superfamily phosphohydrolase (DUF442 family)
MLRFVNTTIVFFCFLFLPTQTDDLLPREMAGLHNILQVMPDLLSGSSPDGDVGFASLKKLGVKTIITVDGAKPDLERAKKFGMRYVHLPVGYNGVPEQQALRIARAVRDLPTPIYLHCHHGTHRGPAAAAIVRLCLDDQCTVAAAIDFMKRAGTDARYIGLYDSAKTMKRPTKADLDRVSADFPEVTIVSQLAQLMVEIDEHWDHLKLVKKADWKTPPNHPDIDPPHEASILAARYGHAAKRAKSDELKQWFVESEANAQTFEKLLQQRKSGTKIESAIIETAYQRMANDCTRCHAKHRDAPTR